MIVELNKIYILSAPKASEGITPGEDHFIEFTTENATYSKMNKIESNGKVKAIAKVFTHKNNPLQVIMFIEDFPEAMAKKKINKTIETYSKNIQKAKEVDRNARNAAQGEARRQK